MARIRTIKPETPSDEALATVSRDARLTFVYLITQADDDGLVLASPRQLLGALYPHDTDVTEAMVVRWCQELADIGCVRWRSTRGGSPVLELVNWHQHQKIKHRAKPVIAQALVPYVDADSTVGKALSMFSGEAPEALPPSSGESPEDLRRVSPTNQQPWTMDQLQTMDRGTATSEKVVDPKSDTHRALLAAAANRGADALYGESVTHVRFVGGHDGTEALCVELQAHAMPLAFACEALFTAASTKAPAGGRPPRSLKYFAPVVVDLWRQHRQQGANAAAGGFRGLAAVEQDRLAQERQAEHKRVLIDYAQRGDEHAIAECERLGIDYARAIA